MRAAVSAMAVSLSYFWRGQKKPRSPSLRLRGTTWTCRCGTLWLTTLLLATKLPSPSLASAADSPAEVARVVADWPRRLAGWATLGELAAASESHVEAYAYFRVGYHRGLDALRGAGWRGSGYVRWRHESNRGFLRALDGLRRTAAAIGETDEERRCATFLLQLEPDWERLRSEAPGRPSS